MGVITSPGSQGPQIKGGVPSIMEIKSNKLAGGAETWGLRRPDGVSEQDNDSYSPDTGLIIDPLDRSLSSYWSEFDVFLSS